MSNALRRDDGPSVNALRRTPFGMLGASTRSGKREIAELAEEKSLSQDPQECAKARQDLTNPRVRLSCELAWLPGLSPKRAQDYCDLLDNDLSAFFDAASSEQALVQANLVAAGIEFLKPVATTKIWSNLILQLARASESVEARQVFRMLNEDRQIAGFPEIQNEEAVETDLAGRQRSYKEAIREVLNRMDTDQMIDVVARVTDEATSSGQTHAPALVDDMIDSYGLDARSFLEKEAENIFKIVGAAKNAGDGGGAQLKSLLDKLASVISNWVRVARPIQVSMKARGLVHDLSKEVGYSIRGLAVDLYNEHDALEEAQRLTSLLKEHFSQFPELAERVGEDAEQLEGLARQKQFADLLTPIRDLCREAAKEAENNPSQADSQGQRIISAAPGMLTIAERAGAPAELLAQAKDEVAYAITACAVEYGNKTSKWQPCLTLLEAASKFAVGSAARERVSKNLDVVKGNVRAYGDLEPIDSAPSLYTINGCGVTLYGNTDFDKETRSYMATYYFVLLFIPIFPIRRYRVISSGMNSYRFLGKGPLRTMDKWHIAISAFIILYMFMSK